MKELLGFLVGILLVSSILSIAQNNPYKKQGATEILRKEFPKSAVYPLISEGWSGPDWYLVIDSTHNRIYKIGFVSNGRNMIPL